MSKALEEFSLPTLAVFEQNAVNRLLVLTEQVYSSEEAAKPALQAINDKLTQHPRTSHVAFRQRMIWLFEQYETLKALHPDLYAPELFEEARAMKIDIMEQLGYLPDSERI